MLKTLEGVKVIEFTLGAAGPVCGKVLSEFGADVYMIEPVSGTTTRWMTNYYDFWSTGKKSVPVNLKDAKGVEAVHRLVASADVFVSNYRVKALKKLGMDYDTLKEVNPKLVYALMTGWGEKGPQKDDAGYDVTCFLAKSGMMRDFAEKGSVMVTPQGVGDTAAGQVMAGNVASALYYREKSGKGCKISLSLMGEGVFLNNFQSANAQFGDVFQKSRTAPKEALANTYQCKDGEWIVFFDNQFARHFNSLMEAVGRPDLMNDPRWQKIEDTKAEKAPELVQILDEAFAKMTSDEAVAALKGADIAVAKCSSSLEALSDPQVTANGCVFDWKVTTGPWSGQTMKMCANPTMFNDELADAEGGFTRGPRLGEHTAEALKAVGYREEEIQALAESGVITVE